MSPCPGIRLPISPTGNPWWRTSKKKERGPDNAADNVHIAREGTQAEGEMERGKEREGRERETKRAQNGEKARESKGVRGLVPSISISTLLCVDLTKGVAAMIRSNF